MFTTRDVLIQLRHANPGAEITEDRLRHALRRQAVSRPLLIAGRYLWTHREVDEIASALRLQPPSEDCPAGSGWNEA